MTTRAEVGKSAMLDAFDGHPPDIIVIDPIRNVFDGGDAGGENDNGAMMFFLSQRVDPIRQAVNPDAGVILAHHTRKLNKKQFEEDPLCPLDIPVGIFDRCTQCS